MTWLELMDWNMPYRKEDLLSGQTGSFTRGSFLCSVLCHFKITDAKMIYNVG